MPDSTSWPETPEALAAEQLRLGATRPEPWRPPPRELAIAACFVCFPRGIEGPGAEGDRAWAAAALLVPGRSPRVEVVEGRARAAYEPGLLALREGPLLEAAVRRLIAAAPPDVLFVNATGRDHPRRAGLAVHLGAVLELPTAGVTHRPLVARGEWPRDEPGLASPLLLGGDKHEVVGWWLRTRRGVRPLAVHAGWRTDPETALELVRAALRRARTPEPLRIARHAAREARARATPPPGAVADPRR